MAAEGVCSWGGGPRYWVTLGDIGPRAMGAPNLTVGGACAPRPPQFRRLWPQTWTLADK